MHSAGIMLNMADSMLALILLLLPLPALQRAGAVAIGL
jgi:hypothetical protein